MTQNTAEQQADLEKVTERIQKLLNLAAKNPNAQEAASAAAKAQELLAAYNLDLATVEQGGGSGKREDARVRGGMYTYERELWDAVARLNFCMYFTSREYKWKLRGYSIKFQHRVVGRVVNTTATQNMAGYLLQTIERLCRERFTENSQFFMREAVAFREGMADNVIERLLERRRHLISEEQRKAADAEKAARKAARAGVSTATALTISSVIKSEHEANYDFLHGEGAYARRQADSLRRQKERAKADAEAEAAYAAWAAAHPEEARKEAAKERARQRKAEQREALGLGRGRYRGPTDAERRRSSGHYYQGYDKGAEIGLEQQAPAAAKGRLA